MLAPLGGQTGPLGSADKTPASTLFDGLLAHWIFDSAHISGSTVTDASGNGNTATLAGSPAIVAGRGAMEAVSFNGTTQRVTTSLVLSTTNAAQPYCIVAIIIAG